MPPVPAKIEHQYQIERIFNDDENRAKIADLPIADRAGKAIMPVQREEDQRTITTMGEDVNQRVKLHAHSQPEER